jgi:hypothetical protein
VRPPARKDGPCTVAGGDSTRYSTRSNGNSNVSTKTSNGLRRQRLTSEYYCPQVAGEACAGTAVDHGPECCGADTSTIRGSHLLTGLLEFWRQEEGRCGRKPVPAQMEPGGESWRGFHEGLATSAGAAGHVVDLLAYSLQGSLKHWGAPPALTATAALPRRWQTTPPARATPPGWLTRGKASLRLLLPLRSLP